MVFLSEFSCYSQLTIKKQLGAKRDAGNAILNTQSKTTKAFFFNIQFTNWVHLAMVALSVCQEVMTAI